MIRPLFLLAFAVGVITGCGALDAPAAPVASTVIFASEVPTSGADFASARVELPFTPLAPAQDNLVSKPEYPLPVVPYAAYVRVPASGDASAPLTLIVALHGMYGEGKGFASGLASAAERNHWVLVGPTIPYGDWKNPESVAIEDTLILQRLRATIRSMPALTGRRLKSRVKLFGFSRGAQIAHRYALAYPEDVASVVAYSAGTYTLPLASADIDADGKFDQLMFPYGIADLGTRIGQPINRAEMQHVGFLIGVGANDNRPADVPRQWDSYVGNSRVERAQRFHTVLKKSGANCTLKVFPSTGHEVTRDMLSLAETFFASDEIAPALLQP